MELYVIKSKSERNMEITEKYKGVLNFTFYFQVVQLQ